jgi:NAD(P)-dependent dehydrogenase (short-subunit alcohol dehydrogenase family)
MKLANKVAVITGAGSGQGKAAALLFASEGAAIAAVDIDEAAAQRTAREIAEHGGRSFGLRADVSQQQDSAAMVAQTIERFGQIDVLYNNAGIEGDVKADPLSVENFDHVLAVNLRGAFLAMHHTLPHMVKRRSGAVINISSIAAITAIPGGPGYAVSKAGLVALTRVTGVMYAPYNIRINLYIARTG